MRIEFDTNNKAWLVFKEFKGEEARVRRDEVHSVGAHGNLTVLGVRDRNIYAEARFSETVAILFGGT